jgi:hypothetical protein
MKIKKRMLGNLIKLLLLSLIAVACEKVVFEPVTVGEVSFKVDIQPIFNNNCTSCHPPTKGLDLTADFSYQELVPALAAVADSANPEASKLYLKLKSTSHLSRTSDIEKQKILNWINQGVPNN